MIRLLHISDLHFADIPKRLHMLAVPGLLAEYIKLRRRLPPEVRAGLGSHDPNLASALVRLATSGGAYDAVMATGDLATDGTAADLSAARRFLFGPPTTDEPSLPKAVKYAIPGNHDRYQEGLACWPGNRAFDRALGFTRSDGRTLVRRTDVLGLLVSAGGRQRVGVIGVDLSLPEGDIGLKSLSWLGGGRATEEACAELQAVSEATRQEAETTHIIWLAHFPPGAKPTLRLIDEKRFVSAAKAVRPDLILSGHTHEPGVQYLPGGIPLVCCGTTTEFALGLPGKNSVMEITLADSGSITATARIWNELEFVPTSPVQVVNPAAKRTRAAPFSRLAS